MPLDYLPQNSLLVIDESHQTIPQLGAMYKGDRSARDAGRVRIPDDERARQTPAVKIRRVGATRAAR